MGPGFYEAVGEGGWLSVGTSPYGGTPEQFENVDCKRKHLDCISDIFNVS